jgi:5'-3' exonuclease
MIQLRNSSQDRTIVIDALSDFYRNFYRMSKVIGPRAAGFYGMIRSVFSYKKMGNDVRIIWEGKSTIRKNKDITYKANRKLMEGNFYEQIADTKIFLSHFFRQYLVHDYESDDLCATIAYIRNEEDKKTTIITGDDDLHQLINDNVSVYSAIKQYIYSNDDRKYTTLEPWQLLGMWGLEGDGSDGIKGIQRLKNRELLVKNYYDWKSSLVLNDKEFDIICERFINNLKEDRYNIMSIKDKQKISEGIEKIKNNMDLIRLRYVDKAFYDKIEKTGSPEELIKKYNSPSLEKYLENKNENEND